MPDTRFAARLGRLVRPPDPGPAADADLLGRFAGSGDAAAFAGLVARHGPMVRAVARRVVRDAHAADDVFQAVFLVLARKAGSVRRREAVGSWLYGVTVRLAVRARAEAAARREREAVVPGRSSPDPLAEVSGRELCAALDEELAAVSPRYRAPLVLCHLQGLTRDEAARRLGWSERTLMRNLARGREVLRARLSRRGIALPSGLLLAALTGAPAAGVSAGLVWDTTRAATTTAAGGPAAALAAWETGRLAAGPLRRAAIVALVLAGVTAGGLVANRPADAPAPPPAAPPVGPVVPEREEFREEFRLPAGGKVRVGPLPFGAVAVEQGAAEVGEVHVVRTARTREELACWTVRTERAADGLRIRADNRDGRLTQTDIAQRVTVRVPAAADVVVEDLSGEVRAGPLGGKLAVRRVSGPVCVAGAEDGTVVGPVSGTITIAVGPLGRRGLAVEDVTGRVEVRLPRDLAAELRIARHPQGGRVEVPDDLGLELHGDNLFRARLGGGGPPVSVARVSGPIVVRRD